MITPIRGRKLSLGVSLPFSGILIRNDNPDKGTETSNPKIVPYFPTKIRNDNPDKGTETVVLPNNMLTPSGLEMITPIRGRKQY